MKTDTHAASRSIESIFDRTVCGVDASEAGTEAAQYAARIAAPDGSLTLVTVSDTSICRPQVRGDPPELRAPPGVTTTLDTVPDWTTDPLANLCNEAGLGRDYTVHEPFCRPLPASAGSLMPSGKATTFWTSRVISRIGSSSPSLRAASSIRVARMHSAWCQHALRELDEPVRVAPLVVVPGDDLHLSTINHHRQRRVEDRRVR